MADARATTADTPADLLGRAIDDVLTQRDRRRDIRFEDAHARPHTGGVTELVVTSRHTGILGMALEEERTAVLDAIDIRDRPEIAVSRALDSIERCILDYTGSASIGQVVRTVDPVLARLLATRPAEAIHHINAARIMALDDDEELKPDQVFRNLLDHHPNDPRAEHLTCAIALDDGCLWRSDIMALEIDRDIPETLRASLVGRELADLVEHPLVPRGITITGFDDESADGDPVMVEVAYEAIPLADVLRIEDLPIPPVWLDGSPILFTQI